MTESTDRELLPCPFCGCNDGRIELQTDHAIFAGMDFGNRYPELAHGRPSPQTDQSLPMELQP